jgi:K+-sensing histidine kinase KdpD
MKAAQLQPHLTEARNLIDHAPAHRELLAEVFHALNQPLAGLRCTLELALVTKARSAEQYRECVETALEKTDEIARWTRGIGELVQGADPEEARQTLSLGKYVRACVEDLALVAEAAEVHCTIDVPRDLPVRFAPQALKQVLFRIVEFGLAEAGIRGEIVIRDIPAEAEAAVEFSISHNKAPTGSIVEDSAARRQKIWRELTLAISERVLEAAGGHLVKEVSTQQTKIRLQLPVATS